MQFSLNILLVIALVLLGAKVAGRLSQRVGLPTPFGKILLGLIIGPAVLNWVSPGETLRNLADIGVILLMFLAGLETDMVQMRRVGWASFWTALGGVVLPFAGGLGLGYVFGLGAVESLFLGAILTATSVSISAQTLMEMGKLRTREGTTILGAAVIDDVMGIIILAFVFALGSGEALLPALLKMAIFLPLAVVVGRFVVPPLMKQVQGRLPQEAQLAVILVLALLYAWAAQYWGGVAAITGAYIAGLLVSQTELREHASGGLGSIGYTFFVPIFFVGIGLQTDLLHLGEAWLLGIAVLAVAVVGKVLGCYVGARGGGFSHKESLRVGVGMMSRGEVALVIAAAALQAGVVDTGIFAVAVLTALATTLLTPVFLKLTYRERRGAAVALPVLAGGSPLVGEEGATSDVKQY